MKKGLFITLEGGEGVGKSTNLAFIKQLLENSGKSVVVTREPGGTDFAEKIRQLLLENREESITEITELLMMFAARSQHIKHVIQPAIDKGIWVLCDRFTDSTYAYQCGGRGVDQSIVEWLEKIVQQGLKPDLTLLLDASITIGMSRAKKRGELDRFESERTLFFEKVRAAYLQRAEKYPLQFKVINAEFDLNQVQEKIAVEINRLINL